jgi:hypothetical protein
MMATVKHSKWWLQLYQDEPCEGWKRTFTTKEMISIFPLWTFHLYVVTFSQHLNMEYASLSWYAIPELVVSCSTRCTRRVNLVKNPMICHEWGNDRVMYATSGTYPWSFVTQIFYNGQPSHDGDRKTFEVMYLGLHLETDSEGWKRTFTTKEMISIFPLWTFHLYVVTFSHVGWGNGNVTQLFSLI